MNITLDNSEKVLFAYLVKGQLPVIIYPVLLPPNRKFTLIEKETAITEVSRALNTYAYTNDASAYVSDGEGYRGE
jgi:hypothetical protein